jgi:hypothetical protein
MTEGPLLYYIPSPPIYIIYSAGPITITARSVLLIFCFYRLMNIYVMYIHMLYIVCVRAC